MKIPFVPSPLARSCRVLGALVVMAALPQMALANCTDTVGTKMSNILFADSGGDTIVLAHRGLWGNYGGLRDMPENSRGALQLADNQCMDGVELDVKLTSDGVPVVLHDWNLGRTTNVWTSRAGETKYNPMNNQGYNPSITVTPWSVVSGLFLLTPDRRTTTGYHVPRVDDLFNYFKQHGLKTPIVFDIKTADSVRAVSRAADAAFSAASPSFVAAKVNATLYPTRAAFRADGSSMVGIPVFTTNMLTQINVSNAVSDWLGDNNEAMEVNVKQLGGLLQDEADRVRERGARVGVFQAIPDSPLAGQFYQNSGACCYRLSDLYFSYSGGRDTADNRGDLNFVVDQENFTLITTDDPKGAIAYLKARGKHD
ncbi:glycerophosphodiester phosphodiesterase family protein [Xanthomonas sp. MUS 060]|uniref:glycerophosphodiester phosphodiesterase family protein n=1 Tax=Xanthomonas sp. MUS 060 TaxID=1588031 RepID=UPI0005F2D2D8|nr:glycerophosphodiester phosphodiesterase family protein [Xanthomonas sp. MUS 060]